MNKPSSSKISETNWDRIDAMSDEDIDLSDVPEVTDAQMAQAILPGLFHSTGTSDMVEKFSAL